MIFTTLHMFSFKGTEVFKIRIKVTIEAWKNIMSWVEKLRNFFIRLVSQVKFVTKKGYILYI